ncbi:MAG: urate hydroxylase PuuD [Gammaproteobacteria bacterium]|jgi:uncharacterized membrane protein|nr:urate hydroxylase PuuD [Gammaproteobacteria bacterium]
MELDNLVPFLVRWMHVFAGVIWIGILYYFNFVQTEYFKVADPAAKASAVSKLLPNALKWFRYGALATFITGLGLAGYLGAATNFYITLGMLMGTLMFLNVWLIIWPNQQVVMASNEKVLGGGEALPEAAGAAAKAGLASRTNTLFSLPMLLFMVASGHLNGIGSLPMGNASGASTTAMAITVIIILAIEANAIKGKMGPMASVVGVVHLGVALAAVLLAVVQLL